MDRSRKDWYESCMEYENRIPVFSLFGETGAFPDVVHCERIRDRAQGHGWVITPHRHGQMTQLFYLEEGSARTQVDARRLDLGSGDFLYLPIHSVHGFDFSPGTEGLVLSFPLPVLASIGPAKEDIAGWLSTPITGRANPALVDLIGHLAQRLDGTGTFRAQSVVGLAHAVLAEVAEAGLNDTAGQERAATYRLQRFDALIARHLGENWRPGDFAAALSITTGQLSRICRQERGMSAGAYIEAAVMTEACRLLAFTRMPVAEVGYRTGFADPSHFSRRFRLSQGETPSEYRARFTG